MRPFSFIFIENRKYPTVIMGEDRFSGWFGRDLFGSEEQRADSYTEALETAYELGVRGFSMSPHKTLLRSLREFKKSHPDIVCIANPHWGSHYYIGQLSLWSKNNLGRLSASVKRLFSSKQIKNCSWFTEIEGKNAFYDSEIAQFRLDEEECRDMLSKFDFCDFCLVGNIGRSALVLLGRKDIVEREIILARKAGLIPLGMCEGGGAALQKTESLDVGGEWLWINREFSFPNLQFTLSEIKRSEKPITAYKIFSSKGSFQLDKALEFIQTVPQIKSIVVGVENTKQAKETFSRIRQLLPDY